MVIQGLSKELRDCVTLYPSLYISSKRDLGPGIWEDRLIEMTGSKRQEVTSWQTAACMLVGRL